MLDVELLMISMENISCRIAKKLAKFKMDNHINGEICIERVYKTGMSEKFYNFYIFFQKKINDIIIYSYQL